MIDTSEVILSILIPTMIARKDKFLRLTNDIDQQRRNLRKDHPELPWVEVISDNSKPYLEGGLSIGAKRQALLEKATGKYICFMDDDDLIAPNYIEQLVRLCTHDADVVTFKVLFKNDFYWNVINMSLENKENEQTNPGFVTQRTPWHVCPTRREIAARYSFQDLNHNEDWTWYKQVLNDLKTEVHTDMILSQYNHSENGSEADKIIQSSHYYPKGS